MNNNYISAEEFLNQSDKVQKELLDWWKPKIGDLFTTKRVYDEIDVVIDIIENDIYGMNNTFKGNIYNSVDVKLEPFPLLQMSQLIDFIEQRLKDKIIILYCFDGYEISTVFDYDNVIKTNKQNILEALWQVTCELINKDTIIQNNKMEKEIK